MQLGRGTAVLLLALELAAEATGHMLHHTGHVENDSGYNNSNSTGEEARNKTDPEVRCARAPVPRTSVNK